MRGLWKKIPIGTRSVLIGAHAFFLHPWFVAWAWWRLYGFPWDPRLWFAFFLHDLGYIGLPDMDGDLGESHPELGAMLMSLFFDPGALYCDPGPKPHWYQFTLYHSRYYAKRDGVPPSRLCAADKLAIALTPWWLYLPMVKLTGELEGYMAVSDVRNAAGEPRFEPEEHSEDPAKEWYFRIQEYGKRWAYEFADGKPDTWTPLIVTTQEPRRG